MSAVAARRVGCGLALAGALLFQILDVGYLAHFLLWTALALPVVSLLLVLPLVLRCRGGLTAAAAGLERGSLFRFRAEVRYRGFLPLPMVRMRLRLTNEMTGEETRRRVTLSGLPDRKSALWVWTEWEAAHCGRITCRVERLQVVDGLGLFALPVAPPPPCSALSLPRRLELSLPAALRGEAEATGPLRPRPGGGPGEDYDLRPYRAGDPVTTIHWKLSSKRDELVVRETLEPKQAGIILTFDHFGAWDEVDGVLDRLLTWSWALLDQGRSHTVAWLHPETGELRQFLVADRRTLSRCLSAVLSDPTPPTGRSIRAEGAGGRGRKFHLLPNGEVAV